MADFVGFNSAFLTPAPVAENATAAISSPKYEATTGAILLSFAFTIVTSTSTIISGSFGALQRPKFNSNIVVAAFKILDRAEASRSRHRTLTCTDVIITLLSASSLLFLLSELCSEASGAIDTLWLTCFYSLIGVSASAATFSPVLRRFIPGLSGECERRFTYGSRLILKLDFYDILSLIVASAIGVWYILTKHWIANNLLATALAHLAITSHRVDSVPVGCFLLCGFLVYDVFWVFGTDVMLTVAMKLEAPITIKFPVDFLENGISGNRFICLGLGDVVLPAWFVALLLRFDMSRKNGSKLYFGTSLTCHVLGLVLADVFSIVFRSGQPALLYLAPLCVGVPLCVAFVRNEIETLWKYRKARGKSGLRRRKRRARKRAREWLEELQSGCSLREALCQRTQRQLRRPFRASDRRKAMSRHQEFLLQIRTQNARRMLVS